MIKMPAVSQVIKFRNRRRIKEFRNPLPKIALILGMLFSLSVVIGVLAGAWLYMITLRDLPSVDVLPSLLEPPDGILLQPTRLYDRNQKHIILTLENPAAVGKRYLKVGNDQASEGEQFSPYLVAATIATYDPDFWNHQGYRLSGVSEGTHPTLAQRLISDLVLDDEPQSIQRNIRERILAAQITAQFGRQKILEWYLNSAPFGDLIYGADAAAQVYFGKSASNLTLGQAAMLVAINQTPSANPIIVSRWLKVQQEQIIRVMLNDGMISNKEAQAALQEEIEFREHPKANQVAPAFTELVLKQLSTELSLDRIRRGGYAIVTTLDYDLQLQSNCVSRIQIARLEGNNEQAALPDISDCEAAKLMPQVGESDGGQAVDLSANVVILDPQSGQILSLASMDASGEDIGLSNSHRVGTIISPFIYLSAFAKGMSPATMLWDIPDDVQIQEDTSQYHGPVRARIALINDYLSATEKVIANAKIDNVINVEKSFGLTLATQNTNPQSNLSDLFSQQSNLIEITLSYNVLANQGVMAGRHISGLTGDEDIAPTSILRIIGADGKVWLDWSSPQSRPITSPQLAYLASNVLSDETARWPTFGNPNPLEIGRPVAVKAGSAQGGTDAWTVGYTPDLTIGVWMGSSDIITGSITEENVAGLWHALMKYATDQKPAQEFQIPTGIKFLPVCDPSGLLVSKVCPSIVEEVFLAGNEPIHVDDLYRKVQVNRETGLLATAFTPRELVEEKVFLMVPPNAIDWAKIADLPIPPDSYDDIPTDLTVSDNVQISKPQLSDFVRGEVNIYGTAAGPDFSYYRLIVGQGLNPQRWFQIGEDVQTPTNNGLLGTWDTSGLQGSYILELFVVRQDQTIDQSIVKVSVDNTPPKIHIIIPADKENLVYLQDGRIMIQATASDDQVMGKVQFYIDGNLVTSLIQPPYILLWSALKGEHTLSVVATDQAGNTSESIESYIVK